MDRSDERPIFVVRLRPERKVASPTRALRHFLKRALRSYGLRALSCEEEAPVALHLGNGDEAVGGGGTR
jgi:hypothetical protein